MSNQNAYNESPHDPNSPRAQALDLAHQVGVMRRQAVAELHNMAVVKKMAARHDILRRAEEIRTLSSIVDLFSAIAVDEADSVTPQRFADK